VTQYRRHELVPLLRKAGLPEAANEAMAELPDPGLASDRQRHG